MMPVEITHPYYVCIWQWVQHGLVLLMTCQESVCGDILLAIIVNAEKSGLFGKAKCTAMMLWDGMGMGWQIDVLIELLISRTAWYGWQPPVVMVGYMTCHLWEAHVLPKLSG